jgi:hypothetical protein
MSRCLEFETGQEGLGFFCCNEFMLRNVVVKILIMSSSSVKFSTVLPKFVYAQSMLTRSFYPSTLWWSARSSVMSSAAFTNSLFFNFWEWMTSLSTDCRTNISSDEISAWPLLPLLDRPVLDPYREHFLLRVATALEHCAYSCFLLVYSIIVCDASLSHVCYSRYMSVFKERRYISMSNTVT